jgi:hypothetical protein
MPMRKTILSLILLNTVLVFSQADSLRHYYRQAEHDLRKVEWDVFNSKVEGERFEANKEFIKLWAEVLTKPASMDYAFDSIKGVSKLLSKDKKFRIITWNIYRNDGTYAYFGFIQVNSVKVEKKGWFKKEITNEYEVFPLSDKSASVKSPETYISDNTKWFGMLYNAVIDCDGYYTLIGWDGNDKLTARKFIDILYFKADGTPVFGKDVFKIPRKSPKRIMFEFSSEVNMSVKYNEHDQQIVVSHLSPKDGSSFLEGQFQYYGPDGSFDAYEQHKGRWVLREDIDARNPKSKNDNARKPDPKKEKAVFSPK